MNGSLGVGLRLLNGEKSRLGIDESPAAALDGARGPTRFARGPACRLTKLPDMARGAAPAHGRPAPLRRDHFEPSPHERDEADRLTVGEDRQFAGDGPLLWANTAPPTKNGCRQQDRSLLGPCPPTNSSPATSQPVRIDALVFKTSLLIPERTARRLFGNLPAMHLCKSHFF